MKIGSNEISNIKVGDTPVTKVYKGTDLYWESSPNGDPTLLTLTVISDTQIDLSWTDNSTNEDGFKIERSTDNITYSVIHTTVSNVTTYSDTSLTSNTLYYYKVRAYKGSAYSAYSNIVYSTTISIKTINYLTAAGILNSSTLYFPSTAYEQSGSNLWLIFDRFIKGLISDGLWDKLITFYPFLGVNYTSIKYNLINPLDTDGAHRIIEVNTPSYSGKGVTFNGANYLRTNVIPSAQGSYGNLSIGAYHLSLGTAGRCAYGVVVGSDNRIYAVPNYNGVSCLYDIPGQSNRVSPPIPNGGIGLEQFWTENNNLYWTVEDIDQIGKNGLAVVTMPDKEIYLGCYNSNGSPAGYSSYDLSLWYYGINFSAEDNSNLAIRISRLMVDLKRITL
jgi:hypothetical protein